MRYAGAHYLSLTMNTYLTLSISSDSTFGPNCVHDAHQATVYYFTSTLSLFKNSRRTPGSLKVGQSLKHKYIHP